MAVPPRAPAPLRFAAVVLLRSSALLPAAARELRGLSTEGLASEPISNLTDPMMSVTGPRIPSTGHNIKTIQQVVQTLSQAVDSSGHVQTYGAWVRTALCSWLIWMVLAVSVSYFCYDYEVPPPDGDSKADPKETFEMGHFDCCYDDTTWGICICAFCCPALRWADTADLVGFMPLWSAFGLVSMVGLLNCLSHGALAWGTYQTIMHLYPHVFHAWGLWGFFSTCLMLYYRQHLRRKFGLVFGNWESCISDFCFILWCPWCAVAQEARVVKQAYAVKMCPGRPHRRNCQGQGGVDWDV